MKLGVMLFALCTLASASQGNILNYGFDDGPNGWRVVVLNHEGNFEQLGIGEDRWHSTGGNPGGYIETQDWSSSWTCFRAPNTVVGNRLSWYGGSIEFDLRTDYADNLARPVVLLKSAGLNACYQAVAPRPTWTHQAVPLTTPGWTKDFGGNIPVTDSELRQVLEDLTGIYVGTEWQISPPQETTGLDNFSISEPVPEPSALLALLCGLGGLARLRKR